MKKFLVLLLLSVFLVSGCSVPFHKKLDTYLSYGQYTDALALIDEEKTKNKENIYRDKNELLYFFDKGSVHQMLGQFETSNEMFHKADAKIDKLFTTSVTDEAYSFLSNDLNLQYKGEDFEQVMVSILKALNFLYQGDYSGARVEARKVNGKLNVFADEYGDKAIYTDDAFARYIAAFAYEAQGELNDAYIDYKKAYKTYVKYETNYKTEIPYFIKSDLMRVSDAIRFTEDAAEYKQMWPDVQYAKQLTINKMGEVLLVFYDGLPPYKVDENTWPVFKDRGHCLETVTVKADYKYPAIVAQDIAKMAIKNLQNRVGLIFAKKLGSAVIKNIASNIPGLSLFVQKDKADTRSWRTIPARFLLARVPVKPGKQVLLVEMADAKGNVRTQEIKVNVKAGKKYAFPIFAFSLDEPKAVKK